MQDSRVNNMSGNKATLKDSYGRAIHDLRISVTDRCNFRCFYCLPHGEPPLAPKEMMLSYEEIEFVTRLFVGLGITKVRLTGGEPLVRNDLEKLVGMLSKIDGIEDLALTTNGIFLPERAEALKIAGLGRVTISLDSLDRQSFSKITGVDLLEKVLAGIEAARETGLLPVKINVVLVRGVNDQETIPLVRFAREYGLAIRFIEYMPLDSAHNWSRDQVVPGREIVREIETEFPLVAVKEHRGSETSYRYMFADGAAGEIGIIAPVTEPFCGACSRIRLTSDGAIRTCLFSRVEYSLRDVIRSGASREETLQFIRQSVLKKEPKHRINEPDFVQPSRSMSFIGG
jgi:GTP 3',8-cyclase